MFAPVIQDARADSRKATTLATSSGRPRRPDGNWVATKAAKSSGWSRRNAAQEPPGNRMDPGLTALTRMPGRGQFLRGSGRELDLRRLGCGVGGARCGAQAGDRRDDHDRAAAGRPQVAQARADQLRGMARVEGERRGELARSGAAEVAAADRAARVGYQVIQPAERGSDLIDRPAQRRRVGDVGLGGGHRRAPAGQLPGRRSQAAGIACDQPDRRAFGGQRAGDREADSPASPGDQRTAAVQAKIHGWLPGSRDGGRPRRSDATRMRPRPANRPGPMIGAGSPRAVPGPAGRGAAVRPPR